MKKYDPEYIDKEEKELMESVKDLDTSKIALPSASEQEQIKTAAKVFMKNDTKMNIRIDPFELEKIKEEAERVGLKYQTFVKSILHKYLTGQLVDKDRIAG